MQVIQLITLLKIETCGILAKDVFARILYFNNDTIAYI